MGAGVASFIRILVAEEVKRRVAEAAQGEPIDLRANAVDIERAYPGSYLTAEEIAAKLFDEASRAGVAIEGMPSLTKAA